MVNFAKAVSLGKTGGGKGFSFGMDISGGDAWSKAFQNMGPVAEKAAERIAEEKADKIVQRAKRLCPDDPETGGTDLRESIRRTKVKNKDGKVSVTLLAGGDILARLPSERGKQSPGAYGRIVHEDLTMRHPHGGQAKFLEQPYLEEAGTIQRELNTAVKG